MNANPADRNREEQGWRLAGEFSHPRGFQDEQWVVVGLMGALEGIDGLSPDRERVINAVVATVRRAEVCQTTLASIGQPLIVRVLVFGTLEAGIASRGWGFFVLERAAGGLDDADTELNCEGRQISHCIELYLYLDGG